MEIKETRTKGKFEVDDDKIFNHWYFKNEDGKITIFTTVHDMSESISIPIPVFWELLNKLKL